jgi:XRE family transcriptional regulator, fatty acid utilization regulator
MPVNPELGARVRNLRRKQGLTQKQLAKSLEISASYLNLIENGKRPLSATLLIKVAGLFDLDLRSLATDDRARIQADVMEVLGDPLFEDHDLTQGEVKDFVTQSPGVARAMLALYDGFRRSRESADTLGARLENAGEGLAGLDSPEGEVTAYIQRNRNWFPELEAAAARILADSAPHEHGRWASMCAFLQRQHGVTVSLAPIGTEAGTARRYDRRNKHLSLSELLPPRSRHFQLASQIAMLEYPDLLDRLTDDGRLRTETARQLARSALASWFAGAMLMPYAPFLKTAQDHRYDVGILGHRFRTSYEQVCHRLTTLQRPGHEGVPFHFIRVDIAGNISKRFSGSGIRIARYSGACPKWNVHSSFLTPGMIRTQVSRMPEGEVYFCFARTVRKDVGGYRAAHPIHAIGIGCEVGQARDVVYADGLDLSEENAEAVGVTCRLCERLECQQRAFPPLQHPLKIDLDSRSFNFYTPTAPNSRVDRRGDD